MAVNFHSIGVPVLAMRLQADTRIKESAKSASDGMAQASDTETADDSTPAALQQKLVDMADDMASVATQFRNRRDFEKKGGVTDDNYERVLDDEAQPKAQKLIAIAAIQNMSLESLLAQARSLFPDDSDLFLVLRELLKRKQLSESQRKTLEKMMQAVTDNANPKSLKGGINCALKARLFGASFGLKSTFLRQTYRRFLESDRRPLDEYEDWIATYGFKARHIVTDFVEESLGTDIRAEDPSCSFMEFGNVLVHMRNLRLLRTADREFITILLKKKLMQKFLVGADDASQEEGAWLLLFLRLVRDDLAPTTLLEEVMTESHLPTHTARSVWLNAVRAAYKRLPPEMFSMPELDADDSYQLNAEAVLSAIDELIEQSFHAEQRELRSLQN